MLLRYFRRNKEPAHLRILRDVPLFSGLQCHELITLDSLLHQRKYVANEIIFDQDEEGQAIYFILSGKVEVFRKNRAEPIASLNTGEFFGERALLQNVSRVAQVRASEDCILAVLFRNDFLSLLHTHPQIAEQITEHNSLINARVQGEFEVDPEEALSNPHNTPGIITWAGIIASTCLLLVIFKNILWLIVPFLLAFMLYYLMAPLAKKMVQSGLSQEFAAISLSGALLLLIGIAVLLFYPLTIAHAGDWQIAITRYLSGGAMLLEQLLHGLQSQFSFLQSTNFGNDYYQEVRDFSEHFSDKYLGNIVFGLATWLPSLLLAPLISFFLLKDGAFLRKMLGNTVPNAFFEKTLYLFHAVDRTARMYFLGLIKIAALDALLLSLAFWVLGITPALILGLIVAMLSWIPYLGPLAGFAIVMMVAASDNPGNFQLYYSIIGVFITMRILDDFVFLPVVVGKSLKIHPLLTIMMFLVGESIAGVPGLMLVIPLLAIMMVLGETLGIILTDKRLQARHKFAQKLRWQSANKGLGAD